MNCFQRNNKLITTLQRTQREHISCRQTLDTWNSTTQREETTEKIKIRQKYTEARIWMTITKTITIMITFAVGNPKLWTSLSQHIGSAPTLENSLFIDVWVSHNLEWLYFIPSFFPILSWRCVLGVSYSLLFLVIVFYPPHFFILATFIFLFDGPFLVPETLPPVLQVLKVWRHYSHLICFVKHFVAMGV